MAEKGKPLAIDLFCGLGGWAEGLLAAGYEVIGFDIEAHDYGTGGYPGTLVLQDVTTLHGSQFKDAALIVASPPCQAYSYRAMPWSRAKALPPPDNTLFDTCFRLQREASEAAGRHIPMVIENVRGAQKWVGNAKWHHGSFYLWGDVPALMPIVLGRSAKVTGDTIRRDAAQIYASDELMGALVYCRIWRIDCGYSIFDFQGNINDVPIDASGISMRVSIEGSYGIAKVQAPREQIGTSCGNIFNSAGCFYSCGSTAEVACHNDYGSCSSLQRFKGIITEWAGTSANNVQTAQQAPLRQYNGKVAG